MRAGCLDALPSCSCVLLPVADGGDGTVDVLAAAGAQRVTAWVTGPLGTRVQAAYAVQERTAYIEVAQACGLRHVDAPTSHSARTATTYGVGELVRAALDDGYRHLVLGLGGSATTDGGAGMAMALGARLLDERRQPLPPGGVALRQLAHVDLAAVDPRLPKADVVLACDVDSPLTGPAGAAHVFAAQKSATSADTVALDEALRWYGKMLERTFGGRLADSPGAGAAGGLGVGTMAFLRAKSAPGTRLLLRLLHLDEAISGADLVLTGEGHLDQQSLAGKAPVGVAGAARLQGVPVIAIAGRVSVADELLAGVGIEAAYSLAGDGVSTAQAVAGASTLLRQTTARAVALWADRRATSDP